VPLLRRRLQQLEREFGFAPSGHSGKALRHAVTALPTTSSSASASTRCASSSPPPCRSPTGRGRPSPSSARSSRAICSPSSGCPATS
jgi:hypothetical protein